MSQFWIKLWVDSLGDPKVSMLSDRLYRRFIECLLLAGQRDEGGLLPDVKTIAWVLHCDESTITNELTALAERGLLRLADNGWVVVNYAKRQAPSESSERVARHRERKTLLQRYSNVTIPPPGNTVTRPLQSNELDAEVDADADNNKLEIGPPRDSFERVKRWIEYYTGYPTSPRDVDALRELSEMDNLTEDDIRGAIEFFRTQGKVAYGARQLINSIKYNRGARIQRSMPAPAAEFKASVENIFARARLEE